MVMMILMMVLVSLMVVMVGVVITKIVYGVVGQPSSNKPNINGVATENIASFLSTSVTSNVAKKSERLI